jgi:hypothetical protein
MSGTVQMNESAREGPRPMDRHGWKRSGLEARKNYPRGYSPVEEHPVLFCKASDREALKARLEREPWKTWYYTIHRPLAEVALAAGGLAELQEPGFHLRVFPLEKGKPVSPVQARDERRRWPFHVANCGLVAFLEEDKKFIDKARQLYSETADAVWMEGGWGGDDYDVGSGWDSCWRGAAMLATGYDLLAGYMPAEEKLKFEGRLARDLEWCQTDPVSPRYNPSWFGSVYMGVAALLLGRDDYVRKVEAMLDQYVDQVLWGEGEYFEGASYQSGCMEVQNIQLLRAIQHVTGRNPADNPRWAMRAEHWIRRASPLGTDVTHSDASLVSPTAHLLLAEAPLLPERVAGWARWIFDRIGGPEWFNLRGNDEERRKGISYPAHAEPRTPERERRYPHPRGGDPAFWLMVPDPLPEPLEPPAGSYVARGAGLACLRTDWSPAAMHTCLFAPRFYGSPHSHWDVLTFDFWAHGAYLVKNAGYHEVCHPSPTLPKHLQEHFGLKSQEMPVDPPPYCNSWKNWEERGTFRLAPEMHNVPTIDGGGGNNISSRADPTHFAVNTGWAQVLRADGGFNYPIYSRYGTPGRVIRSLVQVEPAAEMPGYLLVVDDVVPEAANAKCNWYLHPRGEHEGDGPRHVWTTCDFLNFPPRDVKLEVVLPQKGLDVVTKPDSCHIRGGSFQPGTYLDVSWRGTRRFWALLRPEAEGESLPAVERMSGNLGLRIGESDLVLVRPLGEQRLSFEGIETDAAALVVRDGEAGFYVAVAGSSLALPGGAGFESSAEILITARGTRGTAFCDRPHKQPEPMTPVKLTVRDPGIAAGSRVTLNGESAGGTSAGRLELALPEPGMYRWTVEGGRGA